MKRISFLLMTFALGFTPMVRGQDAATEERLNRLSGKIDDLIAAQDSMRKQITELSRQIEAVREQASKPTGNYANQEDLTRLKKAVEEVDRKRVSDAEETQKQLLKIREAVLKAPVPPPPVSEKKKSSSTKKDTSSSSGDTTTTPDNEKVFEYTVQPGDSLSAIAQAYREKNIKVSVTQILKANPGLDERKLIVGKKIYIPAPQQ